MKTETNKTFNANKNLEINNLQDSNNKPVIKLSNVTRILTTEDIPVTLVKNINFTASCGDFITITGPSGSGKSSLAFDTVYAEGQRKYVESLSAYARQFLEQMQKPDVDHIEGLSPSISIQQRTAGSNPRSTVGTITEIHDYLRLLFARVGDVYCYKCGRLISRQSSQQIIEKITCYKPVDHCYVSYTSCNIIPLHISMKIRKTENKQQTESKYYSKMDIPV